MILELMSEALTEEGYQCLTASNVDTALGFVKTTPGIALIITDLKMPGKNGSDLIKAVQAAGGDPKPKFIVMSGHAGPNIKEDYVDLGLFPFLTKPLGIESLIETVRVVLDTRE